MDGIVQELKQSPDIDRISELLENALTKYDQLNTAGTGSLSLYATLINETLPSLYPQLDTVTVTKLFTSLPGLSSLLARLQALSDSVDSNSEGNAKEYTKHISLYSHINLLGSVIDRVLSNSTISDIWDKSDQKLQKEIITLYAGSKILSRVSAARYLLDQVELQMSEEESERYGTWRWINGQEYVEYMSPQICDLRNEHMFEKFWKLGYAEAMCKVMICPDFIEPMVAMYSTLRLSERNRCLLDILKYFQQVLSSGDEDNVADDKVSAIASIVSRFLASSSSSSSSAIVLDFAQKSGTISVRRMAALLVSGRDQFMHLINQWGDPTGIKKNPLALQESQTQMIFLMMNQLSPEDLRMSASTADYLNSISNRLGSTSDRARIFGTVVAETVSKMAPEAGIKPLDFGLPVLEDEQKYWKEVVARYRDKKTIYGDNVWKMLDTPLARKPVPKRRGIDQQQQEQNTQAEPLKKKKFSNDQIGVARGNSSRHPKQNQQTIDSDDDDDDGLVPYPLPQHDPEDSDDDDPTPNKKPIRAPAYIKDLLTYLASDDYRKHQLALDSAADLIRRKAKFGQELQFNARALAEVLAGVKDQYDIDKFNEKRLSALAAVVAGAPTVVPQYLTKLLFSGDYSIQQRMILLSSLSLGARELAGLDDSGGKSNNPRDLFPSKYLPGQIADQSFRQVQQEQGHNSNLLPAAEELQRSLLKETADKAQDQLSGPQVLRVSRKLEKQRDSKDSSNTKSTYNQYAKLCARHFILPLTTQWHQHGMHAMGSYSEILTGHLFKTLALLLHAAYPTCRDIPDITGELMDIVLSQGPAANSDAVIIEGLMTVMLVILEVNEGEFLATKWSRQVVEIKMWLEDSWQSIIDDRVKSMAAGVLFRLTELCDKWQRRLIGQFSGLEMGA